LNAGKLKCVGAETVNPKQKRMGGHDTRRSAGIQVKPKKESTAKSKNAKRKLQKVVLDVIIMEIKSREKNTKVA